MYRFTRLRRTARLGLALAMVGGIAVAAGSNAASQYDVTIRYTEYGIPHIKAKDYASLGFGYGYASAKDNICILADAYMTVDAQRSRHLGPDNGYVFVGNGYSVNNLNSDFFFQQIIDEKRVEKLKAQKPPHGPRAEVLEAVRGYVAGYNRWLADIGGADRVDDPTCAGAAWVRPITEMTAYRRFYQLALLASSGVAIDGIGGAQPPHPSAPIPVIQPDAIAASLARGFETLAIGSNAVAVGSAGTTNRNGLLLGNPHFPWRGSERFWQSHLTIPGELDVAGGALLGAPVINIGHTATMAWSHTVSTAYRFTPFQLTLVPGVPTSYIYDGKAEKMTSRQVTVSVRQPDFSVAKQTRTLYTTRFGPIFTNLVGIPLPWGPTTAFAMGDANAGNFRYLNHFFETNRAKTVREQLAILIRYQGIPWVNTIAADNNGEALYADISVTPNVPDAKASACNTPVGAATFKALRLPVLDGTRADCNWDVDADALQPGTFGPKNMPWMIRRDYVHNGNDSFWLSNPRQPLTGFAEIIGNEETARTLRTRSGLVMIEERLAGSTGPKHKGFSRQDLQDLVFNNRQYAGELARTDLVSMCASMPGGYAPSAKGPVNVSGACEVLGAWDGRDDNNSRGALLFRRFWANANAGAVPSPGNAVTGTFPSPWKVAFDPRDPVNTPNTLDTTSFFVAKALGDAVNDLAGAKIPLDARLQDFQYAIRNGARIPIHGGPGTLGMFNAVNVVWNAGKGYIDPPHGSSFVQVVSFNGSKCPDTRTILTYSQSANPRSPHYADQTRLFSNKQWVLDRFCEAQITASPALRTLRLRG